MRRSGARPPKHSIKSEGRTSKRRKKSSVEYALPIKIDTFQAEARSPPKSRSRARAKVGTRTRPNVRSKSRSRSGSMNRNSLQKDSRKSHLPPKHVKSEQKKGDTKTSVRKLNHLAKLCIKAYEDDQIRVLSQVDESQLEDVTSHQEFPTRCNNEDLTSAWASNATQKTLSVFSLKLDAIRETIFKNSLPQAAGSSLE